MALNSIMVAILRYFAEFGSRGKLCQISWRLDPHFFCERVIDRWNRLPQHIIDSASLNVFKSRLDRMRSASIGFFTDQWSAKPHRPHLFRLSGIRCGRTWYVPGMLAAKWKPMNVLCDNLIIITYGDIIKDYRSIKDTRQRTFDLRNIARPSQQ